MSTWDTRAKAVLMIELMLLAPIMPVIVGCGGTPVDGGNLNINDNTNDNSSGNDNLNDNGDAVDEPGNGSTANANDNSADDDAAGGDPLAGRWIVSAQDGSGTTLWGQASSYHTSDHIAAFNLTLADGTDPYMTMEQQADDALTGLWITTFDIESLAADDNFAGRAEDDTITGSVVLEERTLELTFRRADTLDPLITGVWTRESDAASVVAAFDGETALLSVLDAAGGWPDEGHFTAAVTGDELALDGNHEFDDFTALLLENGTRLHLLITRSDDTRESTFLQRRATQSEINGRWVGGWRRWEGLSAWRGVRYVVLHNDTLYIHAREDGMSARMTRSLHAVWNGERYFDNEYEWSGEILADQTRIIGERVDRLGWYESLDRSVTPEAEQLSGDEWSSIAIDWLHHDPAGDTPPDYGTASLQQDGATLRITDTYNEDTSYAVEATWNHDHFEGLWWNEDTPEVTYPWTGEFLANDAYLHGTWDNGEWSFTPLPIVAESELPEDTQGVFVLNHYVDRALTARDEDRGYAVNAYRQQGPITDLTFTTPAGSAEVKIDDRARPTWIEGLGETITLAWSNDATTAQVTVQSHATGESTSATISVDLSDAAILDIVAGWETDEGLDMSAYRQWIADNPGMIQAVASGGRSLSGLRRLPADNRNPVWIDDVNKMLNTFGVLAGMMGTAAVGMAALGVVSLAIVPIAVAAGALAVVVILGIATFALWQAIEAETCCYPCGLACFVGCCAPWERPDS